MHDMHELDVKCLLSVKEDLLENIKSKNSKLLTNSEFRVQT